MDTIPTHPIYIVVSRINFDVLRHASTLIRTYFTGLTMSVIPNQLQSLQPELESYNTIFVLEEGEENPFLRRSERLIP